MKPFSSFVSIVVAAAAGLVIGMAFRGCRPPPAALSAEMVATSVNSQPITRRARAGARQGETILDSVLVSRLQQNLSNADGVTRWLLWMEALEQAGPADFRAMTRAAAADGFTRRLIGERWAEVNPTDLFAFVTTEFKSGRARHAMDYARLLFSSWVKRDAEAAIKALDQADSVGPLQDLRWTVADAVIRTDPERGLRLYHEWKIDNYGPNMIGVAKWAEANPLRAAEVAFSFPSGRASEFAMETIGATWAKSDPRAALDFALSKPGNLASQLATAALKKWSESDLPRAAAWLGAKEPSVRNRLAPALLDVWAKSDSHNALAWCEQNLTGSHAVEAIGSVVEGAASRDVASAAQLVLAMEPSRAREEAAVAVMGSFFKDSSKREPARPEAIAWLQELDDKTVVRVLQEKAWHWAAADPKSMADFPARRPLPDLSMHVHRLVASELTRQQPLEAVRWAQRLPEEIALNAGGEAYARWYRAQPETAKQWLQELPAADPRREAFFREAVRALAWDALADAQLEQLSDQEKSVAREVVQSMSLSESRRARLLQVLQPSR